MPESISVKTKHEDIKIKISTSGARGEVGKSAYDIAKERGFDGTIDEWLESLVSGEDIIVEKDSIYEFPNVGRRFCMYIDLSDNSVYRYDTEQNKYYCIGRDWKSVKVIDGGNADGESDN